MANGPMMMQMLNDPASETDLSQLETELGQVLPKDFKDFLAVHNGQPWGALNLFDSDRFLSAEDICTYWQRWNEVLPTIEEGCIEMTGESARSTPDTGIKNNWWNALWIPISSDGAGNSYCIDLDPTPEGKHGQIIRMWHDDPSRELVAPSFRDWINDYVEDLKNGLYIFSEDTGWGGIIKSENDY